MSRLWDDRLTEVWASPGMAGSGVAVGARGVLTARHVVAEALENDAHGRILARVVRRGQESSSWSAMRVVADDPEWDLAVLEIDPLTSVADRWATRSPSPTMSAVGTSVEDGCEAVGFPDENVQRIHDAAPSSDAMRQTEQVLGTLLPMGQAKPPLSPQGQLSRQWMPLDAISAPPAKQTGWRGMSGAGVLLPDGRLVGIVVAAEADHQHRRLYVVPLGAALAASPTLSGALEAVVGEPVLVESREAAAFRQILQSDTLHADGTPMRVGEVADLGVFGVKPAGIADESAYFNYVPRDDDARLARDLNEATTQKQVLLLVGDSGSGKSRSLCEAARSLFADHVLLLPLQGGMSQVLELALRDLGPSVMWLDDIQQYRDPALRVILGRLLDAGVIITSTIRRQQFEDLTAPGQVQDPIGEALTDQRLVKRLDWKREWSATERHRVSDYVSNLAAREAVARGIALGVWSVAGPQLIMKLENANPDDYPCRRPLLRAVLDWYRTGLTAPIPVGTAFDLVNRAYLNEPSDAGELDEALHWATEPIAVGGRRGRHSLLILQSGDHLIANDFVQDYDRRSGLAPLPELTWSAALAAAPDDETRSVLGWKALQAVQMGIARQAFTPLADAGQPEAMGLLAILVKPDDPAAARRWFERAAETGDVYAMLNLGTELKSEDPVAAQQWWQRAAQAGNTSAMNNLGLLLEKDDPTEGRKWLQRAVDAGSTDAMVSLSEVLEKEDPAAARQWLQRAVEAGDGDAMNSLGMQLYQDDPAAAQQWWQRAAKTGNTMAMNNLGLILHDQDPAAARRWFQQAADDGYREAMYNLAVSLDEEDPLTARRWYERAAEAGDARAIFNLAMLVAVDEPETALELYQRLADDGDVRAMNNMGLLLAAKGDLDGARHWLQRAADGGYTDSMNNLGNMLDDTGDSEGAFRLWQRAADAGSEAAMYNLGRARYLAGDHSTAEQWWQRAADAGSAEAVMGLAALAEGENPLPVKPNGEISTASEGVNVQANIEVVNQTLRFTPITDQDSLGPDVSADALLGTSFWWENQDWTITAASLLENGHHMEITIEPADARVPTDRAPLT